MMEKLTKKTTLHDSDKKDSAPKGPKEKDALKKPENDGTNTPVPDNTDTHVPNESEAALLKQAGNPLGNPDKI